jgi:hypothetical protein
MRIQACAAMLSQKTMRPQPCCFVISPARASNFGLCGEGTFAAFCHV